jgi:hypothetical protein
MIANRWDYRPGHSITRPTCWPAQGAPAEYLGCRPAAIQMGQTL